MQEDFRRVQLLQKQALIIIDIESLAVVDLHRVHERQMLLDLVLTDDLNKLEHPHLLLLLLFVSVLVVDGRVTLCRYGHHQVIFGDLFHK